MMQITSEPPLRRAISSRVARSDAVNPASVTASLAESVAGEVGVVGFDCLNACQADEYQSHVLGVMLWT